MSKAQGLRRFDSGAVRKGSGPTRARPAAAPGNIDDTVISKINGNLHIGRAHHKPMIQALRLKQRDRFQQGIMGAERLHGRKVALSESVCHSCLADQRKNHHHVAARAQPGRRPFDLHGKTGAAQQAFCPDNLACMCENQQTFVAEPLALGPQPCCAARRGIFAPAFEADPSERASWISCGVRSVG